MPARGVQWAVDERGPLFTTFRWFACAREEIRMNRRLVMLMLLGSRNALEGRKYHRAKANDYKLSLQDIGAGLK